ncbi:MAG: hypothetical protein LBM75_09820, partial [Myxococcales bacterium]|nr:hypothetical protein [Myxococcales bacterium]
MEGRWSSDLIPVPIQIEHQKGKYVARILDEAPRCGLDACSEVFRGKLGKDGVLVGESRACLPPECKQPEAPWTLVLGIPSDNDNQLDMASLFTEQKCIPKEANRHVTYIRQSLDKVDCERRKFEKRLPVLSEQITDAKRHRDTRRLAQIEGELSDYLAKYPDD